MATILWLFSWYLTLVGFALLGILLIAAWDWLFWRRLPYLRWKAARAESGCPAARATLREILWVTRARRPSRTSA